MNDKKKKLIYYIDDDSEMRKSVKLILESDNYEVREFSMLESLKNSINIIKPDMILLDLMLNEGTGIIFLEERLDNDKFARIPVSVISGAKDKGLITQVLSYQIDDYIMKPFSPLALKTSIAKTLNPFGAREISLTHTDPINIKIPIQFIKISETNLVAMSPARFKEGETINVDCSELEKENIPTREVLVCENSRFSKDAGGFTTKFQLRGVSEKVLKKIRSGMI